LIGGNLAGALSQIARGTHSAPTIKLPHQYTVPFSRTGLHHQHEYDRNLKDFSFSDLLTFPSQLPGLLHPYNKKVEMAISRLVIRNVVAGRGRTSMRLEPELWDMLSKICEREAHDMDAMVRQIEATGHEGGRTSAVRVFIANYFYAAATEGGHASAGHGLRRVPELNCTAA
jgi:predicted DNA-binding ribbon-helix-helix protein